jgi:HK97 family phage portal protein
LAKHAFGLSLAEQQSASMLFANGSEPGGVLQAPKKLTEDVAKRMRDAWEAGHRGLSRRHRVAVLEEGVTWQQTGVNPNDAQLLESRKFSRAEIASLFRIPPHMIGDTERSTSWGTGIEQQQIGFYKTTLMPWLTCWIKALQRDVFSNKAWASHEILFDLDEYLKADIKTRFEAYQMARQNGVINGNEWRARENLAPTSDGGEDFWRPSNFVVVGE